MNGRGGEGGWKAGEKENWTCLGNACAWWSPYLGAKVKSADALRRHDPEIVRERGREKKKSDSLEVLSELDAYVDSQVTYTL